MLGSGQFKFGALTLLFALILIWGEVRRYEFSLNFIGCAWRVLNWLGEYKGAHDHCIEMSIVFFPMLCV